MAVNERAVVETLTEKRERLNQQARRQREVRDHLNDETRRHAHRRDELNGQVRALVDRANAHKAKRDELNQKVREAKARRDELNRDSHAKAEALHELRKDRGGDAGVPIAKLRAEIRHLEYQQQTTVMTPKKEKDLIDLIASKLRELKEREAGFEENAQAKDAYETMKAAKAAAEEQHALVTALANEAQSEHDAMVKLFHEADALRKLADAAQADFVRSKVEADRVHREYVEMVSSIRDLEKVLHTMRGGSPEQPTASAEARAEADDIFAKFRKGEKLSTEDLMALQKGGRL